VIIVFLAAGGVVWVAGIKLSENTDVLANRLGLGEALGGVVLLAIATNLPEIAITTSAAVAGDLGIAVGNILGGIAVQTVVLAVLDACTDQREPPLTYQAASLVLVLEAALVVAILVPRRDGQPASPIRGRPPPLSGQRRHRRHVARLALAPQPGTEGASMARRGRSTRRAASAARPLATKQEAAATERGMTTRRAATVFALAALATLIGGIALERSGESIAGRLNMSGVLFGATILAAATALPELSTGLTAVRMGDYKLAIGDIFGGNAFLPVLFLLAVLISGDAVLPDAQRTDIYLTGLGALLTAAYIWGLIARPRRRVLRMGPDSLAVIGIYAIGLVGLAVIAPS